MNLYRLLLLLFIPTLITITSCGSDDDSDSNVVAEEEDTTGTTTGGGGGGSCMTTRQAANIRNALSQFVNEGLMAGEGNGYWRNTNGTYTQADFVGAYTVTVENANAWNVEKIFTDMIRGGDYRANDTIGFSNGCLVFNGDRARIISTRANGFEFETTEAGIKNRQKWAITSSGEVDIDTTLTENNVTRSFRFDAPIDDGGTGGDDGTTTGGDDGTTTTGGDDGTTTTGGSEGTTTGGTGTTTGDTGATTGGTGTTTGETGTTTGGQTP